ncbi:MAG: MarR family transcriptional regulator [Solirubrobacterales bacterium]
MENSVAVDSRAEALLKLGATYQGIARAQRRLRGRDAMQPGRLTAPQVNLLGALAEGQALSSGQIAEAAGLTPATTTHMLDQLAVAGVVERERQTDDRRVVVTRLTDQGAAMLQARIQEMKESWDEALSSFDEAQLEAANVVLEAICGFVDDL